MTFTVEDMDVGLVRALENHQTEGLGIGSPDGRLFRANRAVRDIFGGSEDDLRLVGRSGVANENDPAWTAFMEERRRTGSAAGVVPMSRLDGTPLLCDLSSTSYKTDRGEDRLWLRVRDVTTDVRNRRSRGADNEITHALLAGRGFEEILDLIGLHAFRIFDADFAGVVTPVKDGRGSRVAATHGPAVSELLGFTVPEGSLFERVMESRLPIRADDLSTLTELLSGGPAMVVPIGSEGLTVGALFVGSFSRRTPYGRADLMVAADYGRRIGDSVAVAAGRSEVERQHRLNAEHLQRALDNRVIIEQAKGFVAAQHGLTPGQAFDRIRKYARSHSTDIHLIAQQIMDRKLMP
jgi:hypothetical protein